MPSERDHVSFFGLSWPPTAWARALAHDEARARAVVARARATQAALLRFPDHEVPKEVLDLFIEALRDGDHLELELDRLITKTDNANFNERLAKLPAADRERLVNESLAEYETMYLEDSPFGNVAWSWVRDRATGILRLPLDPVTVRRIVRLPGIMPASGHLWAMMEKLAPESPVLQDALARLGAWRTLADDAPKAKRLECFRAYPLD